MNVTKRLDEIDILKSIGIILMIMGHIGFGGVFDYYIHSFHMPMFFLISGFLYKRTDMSFGDFFRKKSKSLIIPYLFFSCFHYIIWIFIHIMKNPSGGGLLLPLRSIIFINTDGMPIAGALWFLTALFFCECIYYFIDKIKVRNIKIVVIIIITLLGYIIPFYFRLPFALDVSLIGIGLFEIGIIFKNKYSTRINHLNVFVMFIIGSLLEFVNGYVNMREGTYSNILLFFIVSCLITYSLFYFCSVINSKFHNFMTEELKFIGRNSIVYVCLNQIVLLILNKISLYFSNIILLLLFKLMVLLFSFVILHWLVQLLNRKEFKWILGK